MYGDNIVFMYQLGIQKQTHLVYVIKASALNRSNTVFQIYVILWRKLQSLMSRFPINKVNSFISTKKKIQMQFLRNMLNNYIDISIFKLLFFIEAFYVAFVKCSLKNTSIRGI